MVWTMTQPSGWYDDPQDPSQLRYWDGVIWSNNVTPKAAPSGGQFGMAYDAKPTATLPEGSGSYGAQGPPSAPGGFGSPQQGYGQQGYGQPPVYGQNPGNLALQESGWTSYAVPSTPDGVELSGWWKRVLARFLDSIVVFFLSLPLTFVPLKDASAIFGDVFKRSMDAAKTGSSTSSTASQQVLDQLSNQLESKLLLVSVFTLLVYMVYEVAFLTLTGATPGKKAVGISVRLRDEPGPPPLLAVLKRTFVKESAGIFARVPILGVLLSLFSLLDFLWPLWDDKKQAIHDKVAATNVVVGPQPKRNA